MLPRLLLPVCAALALRAVEPVADVAALHDPALRAAAWARLVEASELHGLIEGSPTKVRRAGPGPAPLLVLLPPHAAFEVATADSYPETDLWPGLELARILPPSSLLLPHSGLGGQQLWLVAADGGIAEIDHPYGSVLTDLDGDGAAELVSLRHVRLPDQRWAGELRIQRFDQDPPRSLLRLLCGAGQGTWAVALRQPEPEAVLEIGLERCGLVAPAFTLRWAADRREWVCSDERWLQRLGADDDEAAVFAAGARLPAADPPAPASLDERVAAALSRTYAPQRFAGRDAAAIIAWMDSGRTWEQLQEASLETPQLPQACWEQPPALAALAFARANRRRSDEAQWPLRLGRAAQPAQGSAILEGWCSAHGRGDDCSHSFLLLRLAGADSCLVRTCLYRSTGVRAGRLIGIPHQTVAILPLPEDLARQALGVLRHLATLEGQGATEFETHRHGWSSADGAGCLILDGEQMLAGRTWSGAPGSRWRGPLDDNARLNLAELWLERALAERLGAAWPRGPLGDPQREERDARDVLARWRAGAIPGTMAGIAARLLADRGAADLPALLGELPAEADARLHAALQRSRFRTAAIADPARLLAAARVEGPEQDWAIDRLLESDRPVAIATLRALAAAASEERQRQDWTARLAEAEAPPRRLREPPSAAALAALAALPVPPRPPPAPVASEAERCALLDPVRAEVTDSRLRDALNAAAPRLLAGTAADRAALEAVLADRLADTRAPVIPLLRTAWAHDLRGLRPAIFAIANAGPEDQEGPRLVRTGGIRGVQLARYHLARQILSLWDEADPVARARLLVAFALCQGIKPTGADAAAQRLAGDLAACGDWRSAAQDIFAAWKGPLPAGWEPR